MKHMMMTFAILTLSAFAHAAPKHIVLCEKQLTEEELPPQNLVTIKDQDIEQVQSLSPLVLSMVNKHIRNLEYADRDLNVEEVKTLFTAGDYRHDDLYILSFQAKTTGIVYYEIVSYPGDNLYSLTFDSYGNQVAETNDGDVYVYENGQRVACYDLTEQK